MNIINHNSESCYIISDIHGSFNILETKIKLEEWENCIVIIAGDCGFGFLPLKTYNAELKSLDKYLIQHNIICYMIRGNHDDPSYFNGEKKLDLQNIICIPDYTIINFHDKTILLVGGAISIDRINRIAQYNSRIAYYQLNGASYEEAANKTRASYWENELPIFNQTALNDIINQNITISHVITHTSPSFAFKNDSKDIKFWLNIDDTLEEDLNNERNVFDKIYHFLKNDNHMEIQKWIYGHFHSHHEDLIEGTQFIALKNADFIFDYYTLT